MFRILKTRSKFPKPRVSWSNVDFCGVVDFSRSHFELISVNAHNYQHSAHIWYALRLKTNTSLSKVVLPEVITASFSAKWQQKNLISGTPKCALKTHDLEVLHYPAKLSCFYVNDATIQRTVAIFDSET